MLHGKRVGNSDVQFQFLHAEGRILMNANAHKESCNDFSFFFFWKERLLTTIGIVNVQSILSLPLSNVLWSLIVDVQRSFKVIALRINRFLSVMSGGHFSQRWGKGRTGMRLGKWGY